MYKAMSLWLVIILCDGETRTTGHLLDPFNVGLCPSQKRSAGHLGKVRGLPVVYSLTKCWSRWGMKPAREICLKKDGHLEIKSGSLGAEAGRNLGFRSGSLCVY